MTKQSRRNEGASGYAYNPPDHVSADDYKPQPDITIHELALCIPILTERV